jgi:peptidoglycan/xylan/chitin deacetylase (PgdA/CDA1 family)
VRARPAKVIPVRRWPLLFLAVALAGCGGPKMLTVHVGGHQLRVAAGTTLRQLGLHPPAGNLVDVEGAVLRRGAATGTILVDGRAADPATKLHDGDRIELLPGRDRREPLSRQVVHVPGGLPANPEFFLARTPGSQVVVRGAISHKLVSARFLPSGRPALERAVALTFDDGPSPQFTPRIVATLKRLHVPATFFLVGYLADESPELVQLELRAGMTVGNHSYNHPEVPSFADLPARLAGDEIALGAASLRRAGAAPVLFRPPGGSYSPAVIHESQALGERIVLWSVDPGDWEAGATKASVVRNVLGAVRPGSIVILHDGGGDRSATLAALPAIVRGIRHRHLRLVAVPS